MKFLPPEKEIELYKEGFSEPDILERKKVGEALSDLVNRIDDSIVVALDGKWGTGKSFFLKRWVGEHSREHGDHCSAVFFDAFSHDYLNDPLPALITALGERLPDTKKLQVKKVKDTAFKLVKPLARVGLSMVTFGATRALDDFGDALVSSVGKEAETGLAEFWASEEARHAAMTNLRNEIGLIAKPSEEGRSGSSVIIVIDELDRCRPDFALEILEVIKHFFSVPHLHFVLGVNLDALENSVRARYGEKIDAHSYLKKFINVTLELPSELGNEHRRTPATKLYLEHLINEMGIPKHIGEPLKRQVEIVSHSNPMSLREIGKIISSVSLANQDVLGRDNFYPGWIEVMNDLIISKVVFPDLYPKFLNATINSNELYSYLGATENILQRNIGEEFNQNYNHKVFWKYWTWMYLVNDGVLDLEDARLVQDIGCQFDSFGLRGEAKNLPMKVHLRWLDSFSFYMP